MDNTRRMSGGKRKGTRKNKEMGGGRRKGTRKNKEMGGGKREMGGGERKEMGGGERKEMGGGKRRKASPWNNLVKKVFQEMRRKDKDASFGDALKEASKRKKDM